MADIDLKVKLIPDVREIDKELKKKRKLGLGVGGARGGAFGGTIGGAAIGGAAGATVAGGKGLKVAGFTKLLGLIGIGVAILDALNFIIKPIMDLFKVILTILFLPLIPILKPVLIALGRLAAGLVPVMLKLKDSIEGILTERLTNLINAIVDLVVSRADSFVNIIVAFLSLFERVLPLFDIVLDGIILALDVAGKSMEPMFEFIIGILDLFAKGGDKLFRLILDVLTFAQDFLLNSWDTIKEILTSVQDWLRPTWDAIKEILGNAADNILPKLEDVSISLANILVTAFNTISAAVRAFTFGGINLGTLAKLGVETGGDFIVRPNGQIIKADPRDTLIATKNPEALLGGGMGGNFTFNITIPATINSDLDIREVAEKIAEFSKDELSRRTTMVRF